MPRIARVVVPGLPHHVVQRGNRRQRTFFSHRDYRLYLSLLAEWAPKTGAAIWSYCLMPNHVHHVVVPGHPHALADCMSEVHRRFSRAINAEHGWTGYLWQGRFFSTAMDPSHTVTTARYVAMNPVRAGLVSRPEEWPYSSASAHLGLRRDAILDPHAYTGLIDTWESLFASAENDEIIERLRLRTRTGRPLGSESFVADIERQTGRKLAPLAPHRPRREDSHKKAVDVPAPLSGT